METTFSANILVPTAPWPGETSLLPVLLLEPGDVFVVTVERDGTGHVIGDGALADDTGHVEARVYAGAAPPISLATPMTQWATDAFGNAMFTSAIPGSSQPQTVTVNGGSALAGVITNYPEDPPFVVPLDWDLTIPSDVGIPANVWLYANWMLETDMNGDVWGGPNNPAPSKPYMAKITITLSNPNREEPEAPHRLTHGRLSHELKEKLEHQAHELTTLIHTLDMLMDFANPQHIPIEAAKWGVEHFMDTIGKDIGFTHASAAALVALGSFVEEVTEGVNPITLGPKIASILGQITVLLMRRLADDPPDGNFTEVYVAPDMDFSVAGASAAANALIASSFRLLQDTLEMLAAAERYQGAQLGGDEASAALQLSAFNAALGQYALDRRALANDAMALHAEIAAAFPDQDLADYNGLALAQTYLAGLGDPLIDDPFASKTLAALTDGYFMLATEADAAVLAGLSALAAAPAPALSGSALATLSSAAAQLAIEDARTNDLTNDLYGDAVFQHATTGQVIFADMSAGAGAGWGLATGGLANFRIGGTGDVNNDGFADLFAQDAATGRVFVAQQHGAGAPDWIELAGVVDAGWRLAGVGDLDGDGVADAVVQQQSSGDIKFLRGAGGEGLVTENITPEWKAVGVGDIDFDGFADVVVQHTSGKTLYAKMANGTLSGWGVVSEGVDAAWQVKAVADVTADGFADVIFQHASGPALYVDMAEGVFSGWGVAAPGLDSSWEVTGAADVDGEGHADIIVQSDAGVTVYARSGDNGFLGWGAIAHVGLDWHAV